MPEEDLSPYHRWIASRRESAIARGAKEFSFLRPRNRGDHQPSLGPNGDSSECLDCSHFQQDVSERRTGEIIDPDTGAIVSGCLTLANFANELGLTTRVLIGHLKAVDMVDEVLDWKEVPMISTPELTRAEYYHRSRMSLWAIKQGYGLSIMTSKRVGRRRWLELDLVTPAGQRYVKDRLRADTTQCNKPVKLGERIRALHDGDPALSRREIARRVGTTRQTVQYHLGRRAA